MNTKNFLPAVKNTGLIKIETKKSKASGHIVQLTQYEQSLNKMWSMFQEQLQRNMELMALLSQQQQQQIHNLTSPTQQPALETNPNTTPKRLINPVPYNDEQHTLCNTLPPLPYDRLCELVTNFRHICSSISPVRLDAMQSTINLLHYLHVFGGEAARIELIQATSLSESSVARYTGTLMRCCFITYKGTTRTGRYKITELGKKFLNLESFTEEELKKVQRYNSILPQQ